MLIIHTLTCFFEFFFLGSVLSTKDKVRCNHIIYLNYIFILSLQLYLYREYNTFISQTNSIWYYLPLKTSKIFNERYKVIMRTIPHSTYYALLIVYAFVSFFFFYLIELKDNHIRKIGGFMIFFMCLEFFSIYNNISEFIFRI